MTNKLPAVITVVVLAAVGFAVVRLGSRGENVSPEPQKEIVSGENPAPVPPLSAEDFLKSFIALVDEGRAEEAVSLMSTAQTASAQNRQSWLDYWQIFESLEPISIEEVRSEGSDKFYEVVLEAKVNTLAAGAPIPNFGWESGENFRWFTVTEENGVYKIGEIATGP